MVVIGMNYTSISKSFIEQYDSYLTRKALWFKTPNASVMRAISFDKKGIIFDEKITPSWTHFYTLVLSDIREKNKYPEDTYANLLIEVNTEDLNGNVIKLHKFINEKQMVDGYSVGKDTPSLNLRKFQGLGQFERGKTYRVIVTNLARSEVLASSDYSLELTYRYHPK